MLEAVGSAIEGGAAAAVAVATTQNEISAKGLDIANKLDSALASGNQGDVRVELTALYDFFGELKQTYHELVQAEKALTNQSVVDAVMSIWDEASQLFGQSIPGVQSALQAAQDNFKPGTPGLLNTVKALESLLLQNLNAVSDTYHAYLQADREGAQGLTDATHKILGTEWDAIGAAAGSNAPSWNRNMSRVV